MDDEAMNKFSGMFCFFLLQSSLIQENLTLTQRVTYATHFDLVKIWLLLLIILKLIYFHSFLYNLINCP